MWATYVSTCVLYQQIGLLFDYTCAFGVSHMYELSAHSVASFHCVLPTFFCYWPFADTYYCTLCSVYLLLIMFWGAPLAFNDLLTYWTRCHCMVVPVGYCRC